MTVKIRCENPSSLIGRYHVSRGVRWAAPDEGCEPRALLPASEPAPALGDPPWTSSTDAAETIELVRATPEELDQRTDLYVGRWTSGPGQLATGLHPESRRYVGLHVDRRNPYYPHSTRLDVRRALTNLGPGSRWVMWFDLPDGRRPVDSSALHEMCMALDDEMRDIDVHCLRVDPGETYLMRMFELPHDGSTWDGSAETTAEIRVGLYPVGTYQSVLRT